MNRAPESSEWVALGMLGKARGLKGDLWFRPYNEATEAVVPGASLRVVLRDGVKRSLTVASLSDQGGGLVIQFAGVEGREAAEALTGATVELQRKDFPPLEEGEYYHCDLVGIHVSDAAGKSLGTVARVEAYPTCDALVIATAEGELEVPITDAVVLSLDVAGRTAVVDPSSFED